MKKVHKQIEISSDKNPHKKYKVTFYSDFTVKCSCPHAIFRKAICKHIIKAEIILGFGNRGLADIDDTDDISNVVLPTIVSCNTLTPLYNIEKNEIHIPNISDVDIHMEASICFVMLSYGYSFKEIKEIRNLNGSWGLDVINKWVSLYGIKKLNPESKL